VPHEDRAAQGRRRRGGALSAPPGASRLLRPLLRITRTLTWREPLLYLPFGLLRGRGNVLRGDYDVWVEGYPRSGNTFCTATLQVANPGLRLASHKHLPAYVIQAHRRRKPGVLLIREPADAAVSWAIFTGHALEDCLDYYVDFHAALLDRRRELEVVEFAELTADPNVVIRRLNQRWALGLQTFEPTAENLALTKERVDDNVRQPDGSVSELQACLPSPARAPLKRKLLEELAASPALQTRLARATELHHAFGERRS
jgi:hypothetical protein